MLCASGCDPSPLLLKLPEDRSARRASVRGALLATLLCRFRLLRSRRILARRLDALRVRRDACGRLALIGLALGDALARGAAALALRLRELRLGLLADILALLHIPAVS
jgi:hypothetical protein